MLFIFLILLTTCSYVDETKIETDSRIEVDKFLEQSYDNVKSDKELQNQEWDTVKVNWNTISVNKEILSIDDSVHKIEKINTQEIEAIKENNQPDDILKKIVLDIDESEILSLENISISTEEINIEDELTADEIIIEETTSEDIEELINILFETNN